MTEMSGGLASQIVAMVSRAAREQLADDAGLHFTEIVRLASLNWAIRTHLGTDESIEDSFYFSAISSAAAKSGVSPKGPESSVPDIVQSSIGSEMQQLLPTINTRNLSEILSQIHSLCSRLSPQAFKSRDSPKDLGVFYTPREVSDYICERTIGPHLDLLVRRIGENGLASILAIMELRVLDPACGPGVFLLSSLDVFRKRLHKITEAANEAGLSKQDLASVGFNETTSQFLSNLYGIDIDQASLEVASVCLALTCGDLNEGGQIGSSAKLRPGDSLISLKGWDGNKELSVFFRQSGPHIGFEWKSEFPEVFSESNPGFDFVVMNPPYGRIRPNKAEFLRDRLQVGPRELVLKEFEEHRTRILECAKYFRDSGEYSYANRGTINTYQLFLERALQLVRTGSRIGCIVPSTLLGDFSAVKLRQELLTNNSVESVEEFPEGARLFSGVTQSVCIVVLEKGGTSKSVDAEFGLSSILEAGSKSRTRLDLSDIRQVLGPEMIIPPVDKLDWRVLKKLHVHNRMDSLPWLQNRRGELDLTLDRKYISDSPKDSHLLRGSDIGRFVPRGRKSGKAEYVDTTAFLKSRGESRRKRHVRLRRIACQQVSNRSQRWRLKFSIIEPKTILANSCNYITLNEGIVEDYLYFLLGILNSELLNWRFSLTSFNNHVSNRELSALPIVDPFSNLRGKKPTLVDRLISGAKKYVEHGDGSSTAIDAVVFSLYGLESKDVASVLERRLTPKGEADEILEAFRRIS
ncbi:MAG: N-6 DNA methylase [Candidatus Thorarchaeota archaeon]|nr:MAG: N-6 DNA methylase [Candidatus Thorarchaeota archaeon]